MRRPRLFSPANAAMVAELRRGPNRQTKPRPIAAEMRRYGAADNLMRDLFTFLEFFAGGGMARAGLGPGWRCLFANDIDPVKCAAYRANFGGDDLVEQSIAALELEDLPQQRADLAWASFPCQDLSLAGARAGANFGLSRFANALSLYICLRT